MPLPFSYPLLPASSGTAGPLLPEASRPYATSGSRSFLGFGITRPFRRNLTGDITAEADVELVKACVGQVLGTRCSSGDGKQQGELPWRPRFGAKLGTLRFRNNDALTRQFVQLYVQEALAQWEPRVVLRGVAVRVESAGGETGNVLAVLLRYDILSGNTAENRVVVADVTQTVSLYRDSA